MSVATAQDKNSTFWKELRPKKSQKKRWNTKWHLLKMTLAKNSEPKGVM